MVNNEYLENMKEYLCDEYDSYFSLLNKEPFQGLRINTLKVDKDSYLKDNSLQQTKFSNNSFYCDKELGDGYKDEYMLREIYYQEPSASFPVECMDIQKGSLVLDMCAAPGSKTTQMLEILDNTGLLVANEVNSKRAQVLKENVIRHGAINCVVLNSDTETIANELEGFFDYVLVDAPCSGEGMMRKSEEAVKQWSPQLIEQCRIMQKKILEDAYRCLKKDGVLVYSTCTFNEIENEFQIKEFLETHSDAKLVEIDKDEIRNSKLIGEYGYGKKVFPMDGGEGQFAAKIVKTDESINKVKELNDHVLPKEAKEFIESQLVNEFTYYYAYQNKYYGGFRPFYDFGKCYVLLDQIYLGEMKKDIFIPSFQFFNTPDIEYKNIIRIDKLNLDKYLHGDTIELECDKGWYCLEYKGMPIGGVKSDGKVLKNHFPKEYRRN